jgi:Ca2+/H+ antiporter
VSRHLRVYETKRQRDKSVTRRMWFSSAIVLVIIAALAIVRTAHDLSIAWRLGIGALILALAIAQWYYLGILLSEDRYRRRH